MKRGRVFHISDHAIGHGLKRGDFVGTARSDVVVDANHRFRILQFNQKAQ
jgi:hypothetical protein